MITAYYQRSVTIADPRIAESEQGSCDKPDDNDCDSKGEDTRTSAKVRCSSSEAGAPSSVNQEEFFFGCRRF